MKFVIKKFEHCHFKSQLIKVSLPKNRTMNNLALLFLNLNVGDSVADSISSKGDSSIFQHEAFWPLVIIIVIILSIIHMAVSFITKKEYKPTSAQEMKSMRKAANKAQESTEEENELAMNYLEDIFDHWTTVDASDGEPLKAPTRKAHLNKSMKDLQKVKDMMPTDPEVIDRLNEMGDVVNLNAKRRFAGSKLLVGLALLVTVVMYFTTKTENESVFNAIMDLWWLWASIIFYIVASFAPQFLIDKRLRNLGDSNFSSGLVGFFAGVFFAAPTFTTVTRYSDGTSSSDTGFNFIGLLLMIFGFLILAFGIVFFGLLNYLRNFVIYV
jgi:ABC-type multidrug transport system fused ATPase/permease subunit